MNCIRCNEKLLKKRGRPNKYCESCRKAVRVEDTQRWIRKKDNKSLSNINPIYLTR